MALRKKVDENVPQVHAPAGMSTGTDVELSSMAQLLMVDARTVRKLASDGWFRPTSPGRYPFVATIQGYIRYQRAMLTKARNGGNPEDMELKREKAMSIRLTRAQKDRSVIDLAEAMETLEQVSGLCIAAFEALPARITTNVRERQRITTIVDEQRRRLADQFTKIAASVEGGSTADDAEGEGDS